MRCRGLFGTWGPLGCQDGPKSSPRASNTPQEPPRTLQTHDSTAYTHENTRKSYKNHTKIIQNTYKKHTKIIQKTYKNHVFLSVYAEQKPTGAIYLTIFILICHIVVIHCRMFVPICRIFVVTCHIFCAPPHVPRGKQISPKCVLNLSHLRWANVDFSTMFVPTWSQKACQLGAQIHSQSSNRLRDSLGTSWTIKLIPDQILQQKSKICKHTRNCKDV